MPRHFIPDGIIYSLFMSFLVLPMPMPIVGMTDEEGSQMTAISVDKSGEWSVPIEVPPPGILRLEWIDPECCWKSKLTIDGVGLSPPYMAVPFGRMQIGETIDLRQLWQSTLAAYRAKMVAHNPPPKIGGEGDLPVAEKDEDELRRRRKRSTNVPIPNLFHTIRISANCPARIGLLTEHSQIND